MESNSKVSRNDERGVLFSLELSADGFSSTSVLSCNDVVTVGAAAVVVVVDVVVESCDGVGEGAIDDFLFDLTGEFVLSPFPSFCAF